MPPAPDYKIIATSVDYPVQYYNQQKSSEHAEYVDNTNGDVDHIDFILDKGGIIKGYVKLENDFTAAGAGIWVNIWSKSTQTGGDVVTDINGMYEITGLDKTVSDYKISIYHDSCMPSFYNASETVYEFQDAESVAPSPTEYRNIAIPEMTGCTFSPPIRSYDNVASSINAQNYTITTVTSLQPGLRVWIDKNANAAYDNGEEVSGAEIYMNGAVNPYGTTDSQGVIGIINWLMAHIKNFQAQINP
ncbi:hypothetical protein MHK_006257 [Candidatus Magnetomorum sp. HK-1]|nr:hypothetical protein MHK_006257 [Candidatus Magnetomorum sp. HK-1]